MRQPPKKKKKKEEDVNSGFSSAGGNACWQWRRVKGVTTQGDVAYNPVLVVFELELKSPDNVRAVFFFVTPE